jgi:TM2 domain-containing membrane protein YozV
MSTAIVKHQNPTVAYGLWALSFFGLAGLHRMYMGRWISGIIWLMTGGLFFVGTFIDLFMMNRMIKDSERGAGW